MQYIKSLILISGIVFIVGCGGGGGEDIYEPPYGAINDGEYIGGIKSYLKVCNSSASYYYIDDIRSNPYGSSDNGPNRLLNGTVIPPGSCHTMSTPNCDIDYFLDVYFEDDTVFSVDSYYRECGYIYTAYFKN